ncbi:MAG: PAS domain-containing sensor histidine kinase [Verrucomicrobia bacterium]|nr:PAS domain-containing sensor histidine kinase [Verrucomicrobiota bacterium]
MTERVARTIRIEIDPEHGALPPEGITPAVADASWTMASAATDYHGLLQCIYDAVLITDTAGVVVDFNWRVEECFLFEAGASPWTNVLDFISGAGTELLTSLEQTLQENHYVLIEARCGRFDGSLFPAEIAVSKLRCSPESRFAFFFRDITVRRQALEALEDAVRRLEEHDRARSDFVDNVSHELRTPLTSMIYGIANMMKGVAGPVPDRVRGYLEMLDGDARRLWTTINDILDLRKIEDRNLNLSISCVPLASIMERCVSAVKVQADAKEQSLELAVDEGRWFAECDAQKMERVFYNLMSNAIKYTPSRGRIEIRVRSDHEHANSVAVDVRDNGSGIPSESIDKVMERYYRVGEQVSGTGLGLPISREIVEMHGGTIKLTSPPPGEEQGTLATVNLPISAPPRVLVFSRDGGPAAELAGLLERGGYEVLRASDVAEGKRCAHEQNPALMVVNVPEAGDDEGALILELMGRKETENLRILAVVDKNTPEGTHELLTHFASAVIVRPLDEKSFTTAISTSFLGKAGFRT